MGANEEYLELQRNEVEALQSIYMDDFKDISKPSAWNVSVHAFFQFPLTFRLERAQSMFRNHA